MCGPHFAAHRETVATWQSQIEHHQIRLLALHSLEHTIAAVLDGYSKTVVLEVGTNELGQALIVLDEHDERKRHGTHGLKQITSIVIKAKCSKADGVCDVTAAPRGLR